MPDIKPNVMIFAAGFGTRMGALTKDRPKPLIEVGGAPLIDHALQLAWQANTGKIVVNVHYQATMLETYLTPKGIAISHETPDILETGGGLKHALRQLGADPVFTLNSDAVWSGPNPLSMLASAWDPAQMDALLICLPRNAALGHNGKGDFSLDPDNRIRRGTDFVYGGAQLIKTDGLGKIGEKAFSMNLLWDQMITAGRLFGLPYPGRWCDVGRPEGIAVAEALLASDAV